jgi:hypothetical protein
MSLSGMPPTSVLDSQLPYSVYSIPITCISTTTKTTSTTTSTPITLLLPYTAPDLHQGACQGEVVEALHPLPIPPGMDESRRRQPHLQHHGGDKIQPRSPAAGRERERPSGMGYQGVPKGVLLGSHRQHPRGKGLGNDRGPHVRGGNS